MRTRGAILSVLLLAACTREPEAPCPKLDPPTCTEGQLELRVLAEGDELPAGIDALAATGDVLLGNDEIVAVIDALDHPGYLSPTGGAVLDLVTRGGARDSLNHLFQGTGLLPGDAPFYTELELLHGDNFKAVIVRGALAGHPKQKIVTRYEVRPCERGLRIRTEVTNGEADAAIWTITDAWYWGGRSALPFTPYPNAGFRHPDFELTDIGKVYRDVPFMAASGHSAPGTNVSYAQVACSIEALSGFHATTISAMGTPRKIVEPRDSLSFDRFIAVADGDSVEQAIALAAEVRNKLWGERFVKVSGRVVRSGSFHNENEAQVILVDSTAVPWTQTTVSTDGTFIATVPANKKYRLEVRAFGREVASRELEVAEAEVLLGEIPIPEEAKIELEVLVDGTGNEALVFFHPADEETAASAAGTLLDNFDACTPMLGPPHGGSPACNRVLVNGKTIISAPPGRYEIYASGGVFRTLARAEVTLEAARTASLTLSIESLELAPNAVSADFHVHGGASFDSSIPDHDRVRAFLASGVEVIAATDHDVVGDYTEALADLNAREKIVVMNGLETTGHVLFNLVEDDYIPRVIGHFNFWPLPYRPTGFRNGAPFDELIEPAQLYADVRAHGLLASGVIQLNHPVTDAELGRDLGFVTSIEQKLSEPPIPLLTRNLGYDTQEVMNGTDNSYFLTYRRFWHYLLDHGIVRAGTANSDSHGLTDNVLGTPRNLVYTSVRRERFDAARFNADVKAGRIIGTNGPVIEIYTSATDGSTRAPSIESFLPAEGAALHLRVFAAPWVPVQEIRILIDSQVVRTIDALPIPADSFGREGLLRFEAEIPLAKLLSEGTGDVWLIVEAGAPLLPAADLDCDGSPDTGDNNGDGHIDWLDVDRDDPLDEAPELCDEDQETGPLAKYPIPARGTAEHHFRAVTPGGAPAAFTNPLLFDRDGDGMFRGRL